MCQVHFYINLYQYVCVLGLICKYGVPGELAICAFGGSGTDSVAANLSRMDSCYLDNDSKQEAGVTSRFTHLQRQIKAERDKIMCKDDDLRHRFLHVPSEHKFLCAYDPFKVRRVPIPEYARLYRNLLADSDDEDEDEEGDERPLLDLEPSQPSAASQILPMAMEDDTPTATVLYDICTLWY